MKKDQTKLLVVGTNINKTVAGMKKKATPLIKKVNEIKLKVTDDAEPLTLALEKIKAAGKEAERLEKGFTDPANMIIKNAKSLFKPFRDLVAQTLDVGKSKLLEHVNRRELQADRVGQDLESGKIKRVGTAVSKQNDLLTNDNTRKVWTMEIVDEKKIPREYLVPDEVKIRLALKSGKKVAGCIWEKRTQITIS